MPVHYRGCAARGSGVTQQINLLLPELRPKRDWLAFPIVSGATLFGVAVVIVLTIWGRFQMHSLAAVQMQSDMELKALQQQVQSLSQALAGRKPDPALQSEIDMQIEALQQREEVLRVLEKRDSGAGHASLMRGFARQMMGGVWLTGFSSTGEDVEIRGRLTDPALLPQYIRRLNAEEAFQGRRFSALDMRDKPDPQVAQPAGATTAPPPAAAAQNLPRYTEFALRGNPAKIEERPR